MTIFGDFLLRIFHHSPYSARMRKNTDQKNSEYGQFSRSQRVTSFLILLLHNLHVTSRWGFMENYEQSGRGSGNYICALA